MSKEKNWKLIAGGCLLGSKLKYPCDDTYQNQKTKNKFTVYSTKDAHFKMPFKVSSISELLKRGMVAKRQK